VLARLNQINGVECSFVNEADTLIRVSLRPDADPEKVAGEVQRTLREQAGDRVPVRLGGEAAASALQGEKWRDKSQVARSAATEMPAATGRAPAVPVALLLACIAVVLGLLWWWHRRSRAVSLPRQLGTALRAGAGK
jgi:hypothetical protein